MKINTNLLLHRSLILIWTAYSHSKTILTLFQTFSALILGQPSFSLHLVWQSEIQQHPQFRNRFPLEPGIFRYPSPRHLQLKGWLKRSTHPFQRQFSNDQTWIEAQRHPFSKKSLKRNRIKHDITTIEMAIIIILINEYQQMASAFRNNYINAVTQKLNKMTRRQSNDTSGVGTAVILHSKVTASPSSTTCALGLRTITGGSPLFLSLSLSWAKNYQ